MDWSYRVPGLRDWVTFYGDAFADDQISPIAYWDRSAIRGGLYFSHLPGIPRLDLRVEGVYTDLPAGGALSHGFFYFNDRYLNGYTNKGSYWAVGSADKDRVPRAGRTIGLAHEIGCSSTTGIRK